MKTDITAEKKIKNQGTNSPDERDLSKKQGAKGK